MCLDLVLQSHATLVLTLSFEHTLVFHFDPLLYQGITLCRFLVVALTGVSNLQAIYIHSYECCPEICV